MRVTDKVIGKIKPMNSVNNGPTRSPKNQQLFKEAGFPYSRNHDAALSAAYGREHTVDVHNIFRNFDADCDDLTNYDFVQTDILTARTLQAETKTFFRLGTAIEGHLARHYGTIPPKDFKKWAVICEHIIRHINEEMKFGVEYWEIWNEPEPWPGTEKNPNTWDGTPEQFFEFYETVAKHLKEKFPKLKIGGPASIGANIPWIERFFARCRDRNIPLDFFSWHIYTSDTSKMQRRAEEMQSLLCRYGFSDTENILNEWNFDCDSEPEGPKLYRARNHVGAAYVADAMLRLQNSCVSMLMYYDARPGTTYNGLFDFYTGDPFKAYFAFKSFAELYRAGFQLMIEDIPEGISAVAAKDGDSFAYLMLSYYTDNEEKPAVSVPLSFDGYEVEYISITDKDRTAEKTEAAPVLIMSPNSFALVKAVKKR